MTTARASGLGEAGRTPPDPASWPAYRLSAEIIGYAFRLYQVSSLSSRDVELILAEQGITVTHKIIQS